MSTAARFPSSQKRSDAKARAVQLNSIYFATDSSNISAASRAYLDKIAILLRRYPGLVIEVQGHCDSRESEEYNLRLSRRRAASTTAYLIKQGAKPAQLKTVGYGESRPIASNMTKSGRQMNRRAQFRILQLRR